MSDSHERLLRHKIRSLEQRLNHVSASRELGFWKSAQYGELGELCNNLRKELKEYNDEQENSMEQITLTHGTTSIAVDADLLDIMVVGALDIVTARMAELRAAGVNLDMALENTSGEYNLLHQTFKDELANKKLLQKVHRLIVHPAKTVPEDANKPYAGQTVEATLDVTEAPMGKSIKEIIAEAAIPTRSTPHPKPCSVGGDWSSG